MIERHYGSGAMDYDNTIRRGSPELYAGLLQIHLLRLISFRINAQNVTQTSQKFMFFGRNVINWRCKEMRYYL